MRIGIFSDCHFGFAEGSARENDALDMASQAMRGVLDKGVDAILLAGDLFDGNEPSPEAWKQAFSCFGLAGLQKNRGVSVVKVSRDGGKRVFDFAGTPLVSIHGTHEHRPKGLVNALEVLEAANALVHIHANAVVLRIGVEQVVVQGLSGVPEKVAKDVLNQWNPKPIGGAFNFLVLHQSFSEFLPTDDEMAVSLSLADLPDGFDLYVNGHLHWPTEQRVGDKRFLLTGSTLCTQIKRLESLKPKGYWVLDTQSKELEFFPIEKQRRIVYEKMVFSDASPLQVQERLVGFLSGLDLASFEQKPLVRVKISGSLAKGVSSSDVRLREWIEPFREHAFLSVDESFSQGSLRQKISELRSFQQSRASVLDLGMELLEKNLSQTAFDAQTNPRELFELFCEGESEKALQLLRASPPKKG